MSDSVLISAPIVRTAGGRLRGAVADGLWVFRGVPYAAPPRGRLRFAPPAPVEPWGDVRDALENGPSAPQPVSPLDPGTAHQDEDCLYLNVWAPAVEPGVRRPVLVWIHGGAYIFGAGSTYNGARLARHDVVVVTINYRLGLLGFLADESLRDEASGAAGSWATLDHMAALRWVQENIEAFGGDPGNVTVFGESAGGHAASTLLAAPGAAGLHHRVIAQSGSPNAASWDRAQPVIEAARAALGVGADLRQARELALERVLEAQAAMLQDLRGRFRGMPFGPVIDGAVFERHPLQLLREGAGRDVPLLIGTTEDEAAGVILPAPIEVDEAGLRRRLPEVYTDELIEVYRSSRAGRGLPADWYSLYVAIVSDDHFRVPAMRTAEAHAGHQPDTYAYLFTWDLTLPDGRSAAAHALDVPFTFGSLDDYRLPGIEVTEEARALSAAMMEAWCRFARTGSPGHGWPRYEPGTRSTMILDSTCRVENAPAEPERQTWERIHAEAGAPLTRLWVD